MAAVVVVVEAVVAVTVAAVATSDDCCLRSNHSQLEVLCAHALTFTAIIFSLY